MQDVLVYLDCTNLQRVNSREPIFVMKLLTVPVLERIIQTIFFPTKLPFLSVPYRNMTLESVASTDQLIQPIIHSVSWFQKGLQHYSSFAFGIAIFMPSKLRQKNLKLSFVSDKSVEV